MKFYFRYFSVCLFFGTQYISAIAQDNIKDVNSCLCFYFNRIHGDDNFINYGLYDTAILKTLYDPTSVLQDSILFFSPFQSKRLFLEKQIALYHLNDVPDFR